MSQKISAKGLTYDTTLPPFLARLRGQAASNNGGPDPLLARNRPHGKPRSGSAEAEDAPTVVDDHGNVVQGLSIGADGIVTETETAQQGSDQNGGPDNGENTSGSTDKNEKDSKGKDRIAGIGGGKKRKAGKVVGADEDTAVRTEKSSDVEKHGDGKGKPAVDGPVAGPAKKKKGKKIKLSFGDEDG